MHNETTRSGRITAAALRQAEDDAIARARRARVRRRLAEIEQAERDSSPLAANRRQRVVVIGDPPPELLAGEPDARDALLGLS